MFDFHQNGSKWVSKSKFSQTTYFYKTGPIPGGNVPFFYAEGPFLIVNPNPNPNPNPDRVFFKKKLVAMYMYKIYIYILKEFMVY